MAESGEWGEVSIVERGGVGIRSSGRKRDGIQLGERDRAEPGELPGCGSRWDGKQTAPVGLFGGNAFGLHNMHGNVEEWVEDWWNDNYAGAPADGTAWTRGYRETRVVRGGSWNGNPRFLRSANRYRVATGTAASDSVLLGT